MSGNPIMPVPATAATDAALIELFSSVQGEGVLIGCRQIFLRFGGCNLDCAYCDTDFAPTPVWRAEVLPGSGQLDELANPASLTAVLTHIRSWGSELLAAHHSLALTGGEPLLQADCLQTWLPTLRTILPLYLETNGTLPEALEPLLPDLAFISMDMKLSSLSGAAFPEDEHRMFLSLAQRRTCQVKIVVAPETPVEELLNAVALVHETAPAIPIILQPLTRHPAAAWLPGSMLDMQARASRIHRDVRLIPQVHRYLQLL